MNFKVGDKVKLVKMENESEYYREYLGKTYTIESIKFSNDGDYATFEEKTEKSVIPYLKNLELVKEYTYEDLKKNPIGTKITFEDGEVFVKNGEDKFESPSNYTYIGNLKSLEHYTLGKIIKIEEPTYETVYEYKPEILDEVEKRYLRRVIRPFKDKIKTIRKTDNKMNSKDNQYITITFKEDFNMDFPNFEPNTMYKRMELYKEYTLKELGL